MIKIIVILSVLSMISIITMIQLSPENNQYLIVFGYLILSVSTFGLYALDKSRSKNGGWRVPENSLHTVALLGGWPGAMLGQRVLRHKTVKQPFRFVFWLTVTLNVGAVSWFLFPDTVFKILN